MFSLLEMAIVLAATAILTVQGIKDDVAKRRAEVLTAEGNNEAVINAALGNWVTDNYNALVAQLVAPGPTPVTPPTLAQLQSAGYLKVNYAAGPFWGGSYMIQMSVGPAGCSTSSTGCHVSYLLYPSNPVTKNGQPDVVGAAVVAQAAGNGFGFSKAQNSATINGLNGAWNAANPVPGAPPAVVLATNGPTTDGNSVYIRRDGSLTWTGDQNVNGVSLHNVNSIDATGTIAAPTLSASNVAVSNAVLTPGTLNVQNAAGTAPAPINTGAATVNGNATVTGTVTAGNVAVPRAACVGTGIASAYDGSGMPFACQRDPFTGARVWLPIGGSWQQYARYVVWHGTFVWAPSCNAGGTPEILLAPQGVQIDPTTALNFNVNGAGPWTVVITDGSGTPIWVPAVATTYCAY
ncbi:hypothetical protein [Burkholderia sp. Ac-20353]|uniref:hypothetical protein n=1 Tax=Burkholderia sp. Ac-20353 TaxID=2703894 RepID=UPI00197CAAE6|nr:hypothetical protein [Burkholderia sp. Ac-20353]MBN3785700.1 hypothetical protein [Burkholderia sp. Ac-20353]